MSDVSIDQSGALPYRILSLDGGGAKGFYTLGVLFELEAIFGKRLCDSFDLVFGTSTGSIIAALIALGYSIREIHELYRKHVSYVMGKRSASQRSAALKGLVNEIFGDRSFYDVQMAIGIVATRWEMEKPMIFKGSVAQAHGRHATFVPGFGCTIADAVCASCSAYPFFKRATVTTSAGEHVVLFDGGYCANNPTLYAIADAVAALKKRPDDLRVVSVGVGVYPEPPRWHSWLSRRFKELQLLQKTLNVNTISMEQLRVVLFKDVRAIRISDTFEKPEMAMDVMERDEKKLDLIFQEGRESFAVHEIALRSLLDVPRESSCRSSGKVV